MAGFLNLAVGAFLTRARIERPVIKRKRAKALIDAVWNIERVGNVQELRPLLRA